MRRRDVLAAAALVAASAARPSSALAQGTGSATARVGFLTVSSARRTYLLDSLRRGLAEQGYVVGGTILLEARYAEDRLADLPGLVAELVAWRPDVIVASGTPAALAARRGAPAIPVVFAAVANPGTLGFTDAKPPPGGRLTGLTSQNTELTAKRLDLLRQFVPGLARMAFVYHRDDVSNLEAARRLADEAPTLGLDIVHLPFADEAGAAGVLALARASGAGAALVASGLTVGFYARLAAAAAELRLPTMASERSFPEQGGLSSYATSFSDQLRRAAGFVDRILRGAAPESLPIEQPTVFEFVINARIARSLALELPPALLARAEEVIE